MTLSHNVHDNSLYVLFSTTPTMCLSKILRFIKETFENEATKRNMTYIEILYFCRWEGGGLGIPPYNQRGLRWTVLREEEERRSEKNV